VLEVLSCLLSDPAASTAPRSDPMALVVPRLDLAGAGVAPTEEVSSTACDLFDLAIFGCTVEGSGLTERVGS
jgi:hypothetical protein